MDIMKSAIYRKYHLMRYYYTQMSQVSYGNNTFYTIYKPMFFEFPDDEYAYMDIANNVMIGRAIKASVNAKNLTQEQTDFYFPAGTWCSLFDQVGDCFTNDFGQNVTLSTRLNESYAHLREGSIIPMQEATKLQVRTTDDLLTYPVDLHILGAYLVPGSMSWSAEGFYVNDDGLTTDLVGNVNQYKINANYVRNQTDGTESIFIRVDQY
jgi:alpha-glucosidase (family GH31 glycosyl hydrolase)